MHPLRCPIRLFVVPVAMLLAASLPPIARAVGPTEVRDPSDSSPANPGLAAGPTATCTLEPGPISGFSYVWNPPAAWESIAWRIPSSGCAACPAPALLDLKTVSFRVRWLEACSATAEVSVVAATGDPACPRPDPGQVLCGPVSYPIAGANAGVVYTVPLPSGCCVTPNTFVLVRFIGFAACGGSGVTPGLTRTEVPCVACEQFATVSSLHPTLTDQCEITTYPIWLGLETDCCQPTPAAPRSWGRLKTRYR
jgi:hypothetical protein